MAIWNNPQYFKELIVSELETFKWIYFKIDMGEQPECCSTQLWSIVQWEISSTKLHKPLLTHLISHSTFSICCTNHFFVCFSCVFTFLEIIKHNMLKILHILLKWLYKNSTIFDFFKKILFIYFQRKGKGEKHQCVVVSPMSTTGDLACNPGMYPDWELNWWPFGLQACTQSTGLHQPGQFWGFFLNAHRYNSCYNTI